MFQLRPSVLIDAGVSAPASSIQLLVRPSISSKVYGKKVPYMPRLYISAATKAATKHALV